MVLLEVTVIYMDKYMLPLNDIPSPCFVIEELKLKQNGDIISDLHKHTGASFILALKAFSTYAFFKDLKPYIQGTTASSINECRLAVEKMGLPTHIYAPAYKAKEMNYYRQLASYITFNSAQQWHTYKNLFQGSNISCGIRVNPEYSSAKYDRYNPCCPYSRLGVTAKEFNLSHFEGIEGLHLHTLSFGQAEDLIETFGALEAKFGSYFSQVKWINFGGGHLFTEKGYDTQALVKFVHDLKAKYNVQVIFEPGTAMVLNTGYLVATVLDIVKNEKSIAIIDTSAHAHMAEITDKSSYQPNIYGASNNPQEYSHPYLLGGNTCLAGDIIGEYSFPDPLAIGDKIIFMNMSQYTMVRNNTFNGLNLPSIGRIDNRGQFSLIKSFSYSDYISRLS